MNSATAVRKSVGRQANHGTGSKSADRVREQWETQVGSGGESVGKLAIQRLYEATLVGSGRRLRASRHINQTAAGAL